MPELQSSTPFVDVIVVLWHSAPFMAPLFDGLAALDYPHDKMVVHFVDNSPGDGSLDEVKKQQARLAGRLPPIILHEPGWNTGFSGGNNLVLRQSIELDHEFSYLLNHDASFEPGTLREIVAVALADEHVGSVQSLIVLQQKPDEVNSTGNAIHYLGFGYCAGYHGRRDLVADSVIQIGYASGAGVLYRNSVLKEVGVLDETLFAYHEDLDLGWRIMLSGRKNVMAPRSVLRHRYEFSRSIAKWFWMERNRLAVMIKNYHWLTLVLLSPQIVATEFAIVAFALKGGWWREKLRAMGWFFKLKTWIYLFKGRGEIARIRRVPDQVILQRFTPVIAYQEFESDAVRYVANPFWKTSLALLRALVKW